MTLCMLEHDGAVLEFYLSREVRDSRLINVNRFTEQQTQEILETFHRYDRRYHGGHIDITLPLRAAKK